VAKAREIPGIDSDTPYATAAARVVEARAEELVSHSRGVLDVTDIERVHDMRVATRRLRAALEVFRPCFPANEFKEALREVKAIADALGERRDRDVTIATLEDFGRALAASDRPGIESLVAKLRSEQIDANADLAGYVDEARLERLHARLARLVEAAEAVVAEPGAETHTWSSNGGDPEARFR
jgi:CHAD domain-containing protein